MLTRVDIRRFNRLVLSGEILSIPRTVQDTQGPFVLRDVAGLGPVKADIATMPFASVDGELFLSAATGSRNIVLTVDINQMHNGHISELREQLYSVAPPKEHVTITLYYDDGAVLATDGWVEENEPSIFSNRPQNIISIVCTSSHFVRPEVVKPMRDLGFFASYTDIQPTGFIIEATITADVSNLTLEKSGSGTPMKLINLKQNDKIRWCTIPGRKTLWLTRGTVSGDALPLVANKTVWHELNRDDTNYFWFSEGGDKLTSATMTYTPMVIGG